MTTTTTPAVDVDMWGHTPALRDAQGAVDAATASGDPDAIATAARALIVAAAAHGWPTATALVFKYETTGPVAGVWGLWRVLDADRTVLRAWDDDPDPMTDESEEELVALDLISNRRATQDYTDFGTPIGSTVLMLRTIAL
ncbi:hypothetical protein C5D09_05425 [Rathayibacter sp. AY1C9]|uniref:hypothetical protein n=1 Tax=Rathayibacter sp. AY1C9 TaxID=2080541 RepID=UPI000CE92EB1|nr:hypothetical protein [Rathayibacter sp. AY1C9]PPH47305.1 hypothetical protein C5D09_05425 [Rathayibacter sp. AY1C9]